MIDWSSHLATCPWAKWRSIRIVPHHFLFPLVLQMNLFLCREGMAHLHSICVAKPEQTLSNTK